MFTVIDLDRSEVLMIVTEHRILSKQAVLRTLKEQKGRILTKRNNQINPKRTLQ